MTEQPHRPDNTSAAPAVLVASAVGLLMSAVLAPLGLGLAVVTSVLSVRGLRTGSAGRRLWTIALLLSVLALVSSVAAILVLQGGS